MTKKQLIRETFRLKVFKRAKCKCQGPDCTVGVLPEDELDAHHITDRTLMPNGGYVPENGIALCSACHLKAEQYHVTGISHPGFEPETLYKIIGSSYALAIKASERLGV
jgi:5-methylcytosine-specific restriction endonuclease McrA